MNDTQLRQLAEQHGFFGVDVWWAQNLPRFRGLLETSQARLTLTEAALSAAVEYVKICESPAMEYAGKEMFEREAWGYKRERDAYYAALDALKP